MVAIKQTKREHFIERDGGLRHAEKLLGLYNNYGIGKVQDIVFVSLHLEVSRTQRVKPGVPHIKELGISTYDTRNNDPNIPFPAQYSLRILST
jgi:hypothetical protein